MSSELPEGWRLVQLADVALLRAGGTPARNKPEYYNGSIPWLKSGEVGQGKILTTEETITEQGLVESSARMVAAGTPVVAMYGATAGKIGFLNIEAAINQAVLAVQTNPKKLDPIYCFHLLNIQASNLLKMTQGSGQPNLSKSLVESILIALPPLSEQRRIAEILSSVDDAIAATQAVIEQTKKVKQGTLERLLTKGIGHTRFKQTKYGGYPESWTTLQLQEVALVRTGLAKNKKEIVDTVELPYLRVANVQDGYIDLSDLRTINVSRSQIERYRLMQGDVLMTEGGDYDKLGRGDVWDGAVDPCLHQNHVFAVRTDQTKILPEFLALLTASKAGKAYFQSCSKQTTNLASINSTQVKEFPVRLPNLAEQHEILASINIQQELIKSMEVDVNIKKKLKLALMSDLLTGRKRVSDSLPLAAE